MGYKTIDVISCLS